MQTDQQPHLPFPQPPRSSTSRDLEDEVLIRQIAAHDAEAFTTLYQRYAPRLAGFLYPRLAEPDLVDDVLHETLLVVWQSAACFRGEAQLSTWIFCIAQRKAQQARFACQRAKALPISLAGTAPEDTEGRLLQRGACAGRDPRPSDAGASAADPPRSRVRAGLVGTGDRGALGLLGLHD